MPRPVADLEVESVLFEEGYETVVGMDEVGRGSLAGPVVVGAAAVGRSTVLRIADLTDSKLLSASRREAMVREIEAWVPVALGRAEAAEIDELGMTAALRLAGNRALRELERHGPVPEVVLLDGKHDWLTPSALDLFSAADPVGAALGQEPWEGPVRTRIKADVHCASVAAASVTAKVWRDEHMGELDAAYPSYGWAANKGYGSRPHREALLAVGPTPQHRLSWNLGVDAGAVSRARAARGQ